MLRISGILPGPGPGIRKRRPEARQNRVFALSSLLAAALDTALGNARHRKCLTRVELGHLALTVEQVAWVAPSNLE